MNDRKASWSVAFSFLCYIVGAPLLTYFVAPDGIAGVLLAIPIYTVTWISGKKSGFVTAAAGVVLNFAIWIAVGNGGLTVPRAGAPFLIILCLVECVASAALVVIIGLVKQREQRIRDEIERSKDLLRLSEARYRTLIEIAPEAIFVVKDGKLIFFNARAQEMLGYAREEMLGLPIASIFHKEDAERSSGLYASRARGQLLPKSITRVVSREGKVLWVETLGQRLEWEGKPAVLYFSSDVTERMHAENALRESEERYRISESKYRNLVELAPEAISVVEDAKISFCNSHYLEMLGYSREEMIGMSIAQIIHKDDLGWALERYASRAGGKELPKTILRHVRKDRKVIWVENVGTAIEWEGRPAVLYFSSDITERRALEEQFVQAQKMEGIGRLAGGVAHDFNNILQVILGFCTMMKSYPDDGKAILNDIGVIEDSARRAASLTQQLLAFSRKQVVQPKVMDLGELVQQSEKMLGRVLGEDIALTIVLDGEESRVKADSGQFQQVIMNLAINARDALPHGGRIRISVENLQLREQPGSKIPAGNYVRLAVSDNGRGMDQDTIAHLFEPFFTTKRVGEGTGLGLSIVYGIVRQNGGHIHVTSEVGAGSTFTIYLPRVFEPVDVGRARVEAESESGSGSILVVEDEKSVRSLVRRILERVGYTVTEAESGEEAIRICQARPEGFDLLITDIVLPGMRGDEVAGSIRRFSPRVRTIYMSGYVEERHSPKLEGAANLRKPFSADALLAEVKKALEQGRPAGSIGP